VRLGILKADAVLPHLATRFGEYPDMFQRVLSAADPSLTYETYDVEHGSLPASLDDCDGWLITGSRRSVYEQVPWIERLGELTRQLVAQRRKLVAVCFGHQMVAHVLGGKTARAAHGWTVGVQEHRIDAPFPWDPDAKTVRMIHTHQDQVMVLPAGGERVGGNALVPNGLYRIGDHVMSFQGHPEFDPDYARALYDGRRAILGEQTYGDAVESLVRPDDAAAISRAVAAFLRGRPA